LLLSTSMPTDPTRDGRQRRYVLSPDLLGVGSAGGAWTRMGVQIGQYHGSACYATSPPVLRCWSLGWPRPGRYVVPSKSSPRPGPRRTENVAGEGVRRDPCGQNPRRRCAMRVGQCRTAGQPSGCPPDVEVPICSGAATALAAALCPGRPRRLRYRCTRTSEFRRTRTSEFLTSRRVGAGALAASRAA